MSKLLTIEKECKSEAGYMCKSFISPEIKNRVYVDVLGAELLKNYLTEECEINAQNLSSMHSITRVVERINIADIILPNIYI